MEHGELGGTIHRVNNANIESSISRGPDSKFFDNFSGNLISLAGFFAPNTPNTSVRTEPIESNVGILPAPAKKIAVQAILSGQAIPPMRVSEREVIYTKKDQLIGSVYLPVILEVSPYDTASLKRQAGVVNTLLSLGKIASSKEIGIKSGKDGKPFPLTLNVNELDVVVHLIRRGALGYVDYKSMPIAFEQDAQEALSEYARAVDYVVRFHPEDRLKDPKLGKEVIYSRIVQDIENRQKQGLISLVVADEEMISGLKIPYLLRGDGISKMKIQEEAK